MGLGFDPDADTFDLWRPRKHPKKSGSLPMAKIKKGLKCSKNYMSWPSTK